MDFESSIPDNQVREFLEEKFHSEISDLQFIAKGMFSQACCFQQKDKKFVIRIGYSRMGFEKDRWVAQHFSQFQLPLPVIMDIGSFSSNLFFCISSWLPGFTFENMDPVKEMNLVSKVIETLDEIRKIPVAPYTGYGELNENGRGLFPSWKSYITHFENWEKLIHKRNDEEFKPLDQLFEESFLEKNLFRKASEEVRKLAEFCPEEPHYIHGDFGYDNLLTDGNKITGIIDWAELRCGDFLVDLAAIDLGKKTTGYADAFQRFCNLNKIAIPHFEKRVRCYQILMILKGMYLEANRNQVDWYREDRLKLKGIGIE